MNAPNPITHALEPFYNPEWLSESPEMQFSHRLNYVKEFLEKCTNFFQNSLPFVNPDSTTLEGGLKSCLGMLDIIRDMLKTVVETYAGLKLTPAEYIAVMNARDPGELTYIALEMLQILADGWKFMLVEMESDVKNAWNARQWETQILGLPETSAELEFERKVQDTLRDSEACRMMPYDLRSEDRLWKQVRDLQFVHWELTQARGALCMPRTV